MARRTKDVRIHEAGRDQGKVFKITEMSAFETEKWATCSINAILRNATSQDIAMLLPLTYSYIQQLNQPKTLEETQKDVEEGKAALLNSTEALAVYFAQMFFSLPFEELQQVADPLLNCCVIYLTPGQNDLTESLSQNPNLYVEEPSTLYVLRKEAFALHTDFFIQGVRSYLSQYTANNVLADNPASVTPPTSPPLLVK